MTALEREDLTVLHLAVALMLAKAPDVVAQLKDFADNKPTQQGRGSETWLVRDLAQRSAVARLLADVAILQKPE